MKLLEKVFSIKNVDTQKVITLLGMEVKFKNKNRILQMQNREYIIRKLLDNNYERLLSDYKYNGFSIELLKEFEKYARSKHCWFVENNNLWLLYMLVVLENNQLADIGELAKKYQHFHKLKDVENWPAVANYFCKQGYKNELIEKSSEIFEKLKASEGKFAELIKDKSIAVVGNGPVEVGKGHGKEIDSHDIVIRFNEFHTEGDYAKDYGTRTDVWVNYSANPNFKNFNKNFDCKLMLWLFDCFYFRDFIGLYNLDSVKDKNWDMFGVDTAKEVWNKYQFYYAPTTGFYLIMYLYKLRKSFENIDFYGFKFLETENCENLHYYDNKTLDSLNYHNITAECHFFKSLFKGQKHGE